MTKIKGKAADRELWPRRSWALIASLLALSALAGGAQALAPASAAAMTSEADDCSQMIGPDYWDDCADGGGESGGGGGTGTTGDPAGGGGPSNPTAPNGQSTDPYIDPNTHDWKPSPDDLVDEPEMGQHMREHGLDGYSRTVRAWRRNCQRILWQINNPPGTYDGRPPNIPGGWRSRLENRFDNNNCTEVLVDGPPL